MKKIITFQLLFFIYSLVICNAQYVTLCTPNRSTIETFLRNDWEEQEKIDVTNYYRSEFPDAEVLAEATPTYNCHSYAWNLSEGGTQVVWMNQFRDGGNPNLSKYWTDGSYEETTETNAQKIFYYSGDHSAVRSTRVGKYESKWGSAPLMRHDPNYGPASYHMTDRRYYRSSVPAPSISGPYDICFSWSFFSVDNLFSGDSITWNQSANISRRSQQGSNPCLFTGITSGAGWVEATINMGCGSIILLPRKSVWVGVPDYTQLDISLESGKLISCGYVSGTSKYNGTPWPGIDAYEWYLPNAQNWNVEDESSMPAIAYKYVELEYWEDPAPSQEDIYIRAHNSCGWSEWKHTIWSVVDNCGWYLIFSPDSDTGGTKITIASGTAEKSFAETTEWNLEIYNQSQLLKEKKIKLKGNSTVINTSGWQEGVYTVQVKFDDEVLTDKLLIKR